MISEISQFLFLNSLFEVYVKYLNNFPSLIKLTLNLSFIILLSPLCFGQTNENKDKSSSSFNFDSSVSPFIHSFPKTLSAQKLSSSAYPEEAEIYCGTDNCIFGLTRGFVVGSDVFGMIYAPIRPYTDKNWVSGNLYIIDAFGGYQILRDEKSRINMNTQIGYRKIGFNDGVNELSTQGVTIGVHYSQRITSLYMQSITFDGFLKFRSTSINDAKSLVTTSPNHQQLNNSASYFYRISENYPTYRLAFPADLEVANWSTKETGLHSPIHGYLELSPFYIQNELIFSENNIALQKIESNFGLTMAAVVSYESTAEKSKSGRYALKGLAGIDISSGNFTTTSSGHADLSLPTRPIVAPNIVLAGTWQF